MKEWGGLHAKAVIFDEAATLADLAEDLTQLAEVGPLGLRVLVAPSMPSDELLMFQVVGHGFEKRVEAVIVKGLAHVS